MEKEAMKMCIRDSIYPLVRSYTRQLEKSVYQIWVKNQRLERLDRKRHIVLFHHYLCCIDCGKWSIECEVKFSFVPCLWVIQSGVLFCITVTEFDLESCPVKFNDLFAGHINVLSLIHIYFTEAFRLMLSQQWLLTRLGKHINQNDELNFSLKVIDIGL